ncbi:MAG: UDP-glucose/GDP-mannose dehydrogenase family protein, partial [Candidatus Diapherotrites archaeon]
YVGLVAGACFADLGNNVVCVDVDREKVEMLKKGKSPIFEPGLEEMLEKNIKAGRLSFTTSTAEAVKKSQIIFIAVGTPQGENGESDLKYVEQAANAIGQALDCEKIIVNKSTVPVGTGNKVAKIIGKHYKGKFHVVSNPEFLREGSAINDFLKPDRIVIGSNDEKASKTMEELYRTLGAKILFTDIESAELIKYGSNAMLATKISFINEIARLCDKVGANIEAVAEGIGLDKRIGPAFLKAGCGWGGSCFPKDVKALIHTAKKYGVDLKIPRAAEETNKEQKLIPVKKLKKHFKTLKGKKIALLGLSFKPNTDDMREAPSIEIAKKLLKEGAKISAYDPVAITQAKKTLKGIEFASSPYTALKNADAMLLVTEWNEFREMDFERIKRIMKKPLVIDGRNIYNRKSLQAMGFAYEGIGK